MAADTECVPGFSNRYCQVRRLRGDGQRTRLDVEDPNTYRRGIYQGLQIAPGALFVPLALTAVSTQG